MSSNQWLQFDLKFPKSSRVSKLLVEFARSLSAFSHVETDYERIASIELARRRAERDCVTCDLDKRQPVLAGIHVLSDLAKQGWYVRVINSTVEIFRPRSDAEESFEERQRVRSQLHVERDEQLRQPAVQSFVRSMESRQLFNGRFVSIFSLMRNGPELAMGLQKVRDLDMEIARVPAASQVIQPYLQFIRSDERCEMTGLRLVDIWRYFRHTWANPYKSIPGRTMMVLIRDAAAPYHPVIGIAALSSAAVAVTVRDKNLGWTPATFLKEMQQNPSVKLAKWMQRTVDEAIEEIYTVDLLEDEILTPRDLKQPSQLIIRKLEAEARQQRKEHYRFMQSGDYKKSGPAGKLPGEHWLDQARSPLFRSKRAGELAKLLGGRIVLQRIFDGRPTKKGLEQLLNDKQGRDAVSKILRKAKSIRVGTAMADLTVCGAIPPYNEILGGKLVAMLMTSPEVVQEYRHRYRGLCSVIASSMAGHPITRTADLVFIGTTSLYGQRPSQYDRISIPCKSTDNNCNESVRYEYLGRTKGMGTFQFSDRTVRELGLLLAQSAEGQRINSVFGEGVNPRLRKIRDGLNQLGLPDDQLLDHGVPRLVYGVRLAHNTRQYLLGIDTQPKCLFSQEKPSAITQQIVNWWVKRWLVHRLQRDDILEQVAQHTLTHPIQHGARIPLPPVDIAQKSLFED